MPERGDSLNKMEAKKENENGKKVGDYVIPKSEIIPIKLRSRDQVINKWLEFKLCDKLKVIEIILKFNSVV